MRDWENYKGIIFGMAYKYSPNSQETEDMVGEGFVCFMEVVNEENKFGLSCPFEAALSNHIKQHYLNMIEKKKALKRTGDVVPFLALEEKIGKNPWGMIEQYFCLSKGMREVVDVIANAPQEFIDLLHKENFKTGLSKYLKKYKGWTPSEVNNFWEEFKLEETT
jgi:hypothetical protein